MKDVLLPMLVGILIVGYPLPIENSAIHLAGVSSVRAGYGAVQVAEAAASEDALNTYMVWVTAYSSTPEETDETPFLTASNTDVRDGVIAANFLPFGTRVKIPALFGDRIFVVEDRMHYRKTGFVDVWMPTREEAVDFGIIRTDIVVVK